MEYVKLQIACMIIVLYVTFIYIREKRAYGLKSRDRIFESLLLFSIISITFDGITAYSVNHLEQIPSVINSIFHAFFLCGLDLFVFSAFLYITDISRGLPVRRKNKLILRVPLVINLAVVILFIPQLTYHHGKITNYSMGISAYTCFVMLAVYMTATLIILFVSWENLGRHKLITILTYVMISIVVAVYQMLNPEALISCLVPTVLIVGTYINMENPAYDKLRHYNQEMVMGFAALVENRDNSTGGHIKRTTEYVRMLAYELEARGYYKDILTKDYIQNLVVVAPMHDVGKIAIPDAILQKPGRLSDEEFEVMKSHAERGGDIIKETFDNIGDDEYKNIAYEVARFHHEKWNGKGYPEGLSRKKIPLSARIMAVADVFDAVSAKRCYRDAMPLDECFKIIENGSGQDFDPIIAEVFLDMEDKIREYLNK